MVYVLNLNFIGLVVFIREDLFSLFTSSFLFSSFSHLPGNNLLQIIIFN